METVLFIVGDLPVTALHAVIAGCLLAGLVLATVMLSAMRASAQRAEAAASQAAEQLRASFMSQIADRDGRIGQLERQLDHERERGFDLLQLEREKGSELWAEVSGLRERLAEQARQSQENMARFLDARQQMTDEFKAIAGDVLKSHGETFSKQNREQVDTLLKPLQDKIGEFHTGLIKDRATMAGGCAPMSKC